MSSQNSLKSVEARDPATSVQRLYEIASSSPELHLDLLFNPSCTSGLRSWIAQENPPALAAWQAAHLGVSASSPAETTAAVGAASGATPTAPSPTQAVSRTTSPAEVMPVASTVAPEPAVPAASAPITPAHTTVPVPFAEADLATAETADLASVRYSEPTTAAADLDALRYDGPTAGSPAFAPSPAVHPATWSGVPAGAPMAVPMQPVQTPPQTVVLPAMDLPTAPTAEAASMGGWELLPTTPWPNASGGGLGVGAYSAASAGSVNPEPERERKQGSASRWIAVAAALLLLVGGGKVLADNLRHGGPVKASVPPTVQAVETPQTTSQEPSPAQSAVTPSRKPTVSKVRPAPDNAYRAALFDTQTQNISCELSDVAASCSIAQRLYAEVGQPDCSGPLFSISVGDGAPAMVCGETFLGTPGQFVQRVQPNQYAASKNFACLVEYSGVSCWNQWTGHGFKIAREGYETF